MSIFTARSKKKTAALLLAAALLLVAAVGGTLAYLSAQTGTIINTFVPASVTCDIIETVTDNTKTSVTVQNTGGIDAYIRVAVIGNTVDDSGNVTGSFDLSAYLAGSAWTQGSDGYYYYSAPVAPDGSTSELLKADLPLTGRMVTILAEAIQADGMGVTSAETAFAYAAAHGSTGGGE
ncbi:MAG: hypothetical protein IK116_00845 [Firmicutes bacterium]|nr:hypothetical protein [Bacillota bacterium]